LAGLGLNEAQGQTLVSSAECGGRKAEWLPLANPLSSDMDVLRPSLLPGLLNILRHNVSRKNLDVSVFEIGRVFARAPEGAPQRPKSADALAAGFDREERRLAIALTGRRHPVFWSGGDRDAKFDLYDLKGLLEEFFDQFGVRGLVYTRRAENTALFLESATVQIGKLPLGELGLLLPALTRRYDLRDAVLLAELDLDQLLARRNASKAFRTLPAFPTIRRDVAMLVPEATSHDAVLQSVRQAKPANLESVELFDVFRGKNVPEGRKSMAYAFIYRHAERTLTDAEVNAAQEKVVAQLKTSLEAAIRDS